MLLRQCSLFVALFVMLLSSFCLSSSLTANAFADVGSEVSDMRDMMDNAVHSPSGGTVFTGILQMSKARFAKMHTFADQSGYDEFWSTMSTKVANDSTASNIDNGIVSMFDVSYDEKGEYSFEAASRRQEQVDESALAIANRVRRQAIARFSISNRNMYRNAISVGISKADIETQFYNDKDSMRMLSKTAYDVLNDIVEYDYDSLEDTGIALSANSAWGALTYGKAQCLGYARAYCTIMRALGIPCEIVLGMHKTGRKTWTYHAWNKIDLNERHVYVDCCVGDNSAKPCFDMNKDMMKSYRKWVLQ